MKRLVKTIALFTLVALCLTVACTINASAAFTDINASPYKVAIEQLAELKITAGKSASEFGINDNVTRQQMTLFIARIMTGNEINGFDKTTNDTRFTDITDPTYFKSISYCYENGIIKGRSETIFDPTGNVTVQEAVTMAVRALGYSDLTFPDGYVNKALTLQLFSQLEMLNRAAPMTRGQVAQLLYNTIHCPNLAESPGTSLLDREFPKETKLGYFEITTFDELRANYHYKAARYNLRDGWDSYIVEDATFLGYTGDLQYYFEKDKTDYDIYFRFTIMGEAKSSSPVNTWIENPCNELTAEEAKALLDPINSNLAEFIGLPIVEYHTPIYADGTPSIKDGAPEDIYKATVDNYTSLVAYYKEMDGDKYLPKTWSLDISATTIGNIKGCILEGTIRFYGR